MPITAIGALVGACGLIGVPLTNGFVSKWLIYKTLILKGYPFLAFAALVGTWGTILSLFKFVHNIFLGQLPEKYKDVKKAPFSMQLPIMVFSFIIILFGVLPGIPLKVINKIIVSFGLDSLNINIWGIASETGTLNTINIFAAIVATFLVVWFVLKVARKSKRVEQENNYAAGAAVPVGKYHYTVDFYGPLYKMITPYLRDFIDDLYMSFARGIQNLCGVVRRIYTGEVGFYVMYIILFLAAIIFAQIKWSIW
jgi:NADH-quinone oxidoreductase subunit M